MATNPLLPCPDDSGPQRPQLAAVPTNSGNDTHIEILLPERFYSSLGRRLLSQIRDLLFPPKYPPLRNLSQPVNVILPLGEMLRAPWYRTIFTSLGDVLAPENLPPLQLESRPVEVEELVSDLTAEPWWRSLLRSLGEAISPEQLPPLELESRPAEVEELISDSTSKPWWTSLIRSIGDAVSPEVLPALELSAIPINPGISEVGLVTPHWSSLISAPAVGATSVRSVESVTPPVHAVVHTEPKAPQKIPESLPIPLEALQVDADSVDVLVAQFQDNLSRSKRREVIWISLASAEMIFLIALAAGLLH
jgi:hypothetical protein